MEKGSTAVIKHMKVKKFFVVFSSQFDSDGLRSFTALSAGLCLNMWALFDREKWNLNGNGKEHLNGTNKFMQTKELLNVSQQQTPVRGSGL